LKHREQSLVPPLRFHIFVDSYDGLVMPYRFGQATLSARGALPEPSDDL
jgi:hypothetical protein